jgi:hypothetical protein
VRIARRATSKSAMLLGIGVLVLGLSVATASAKPVTYDFHAGDGFADIKSPDVSAAANGDAVTIDATGTFRPAGHKANGGGTFVHKGGGRHRARNREHRG